MTGVLVGVDAGTTTVKAVAHTLTGRALGSGRRPTPWRERSGVVRMDADELTAAALGAIGDALSGVSGDVIGVGVTGMAESGVLVDVAGRALTPILAWYDERPDAVLPDVRADVGGDDAFTTRTGLPLSTRCTAVKTRWLADQDLVDGAPAGWATVPELLVARLGGSFVNELSLAARTGWLDVHERRWLPGHVAASGVRLSLPEPVPAGAPAGRADPGGRLAGAVLTVGGHDHLCAAVGAGATRPGDVLNSLGTGEAMVRQAVRAVGPAATVAAVRAGVTVGCHVFPGTQSLFTGLGSGLALRRFLRLLGVAEDDHEARRDLDAAALALAPDPVPIGVADVAGAVATLTGIPAEPSPAMVWRAALDAVMRRGRAALDVMASVTGPHTRVVAVGGWLRGDAVVATKRAALGDVLIPPVAEAAARGAALFAGLAAGRYDSIDDLPDPTDQQEANR
ncbi:FGGY-family carbohydrate kinase [Jiangella alba]|uniref:Sugar (Pentulose or hexulose) kinase n=1 Tax=Jiangella alba TaxID=561176 RepID=A0A1H5MMG3_9ACTN|nr:FGGY family carbohydrate kinase [Jiangella alba]SEE90496.1 Sugar (pentulose or hexulose) kinase [Jiangella alba]